jgi:hypothetical protein
MRIRLVMGMCLAMAGRLKRQPTIEPQKDNQQNSAEKAATAWFHKAGTF